MSAARRYCSHCNAAFASNIDKCPRDGADLQARETNPLLGRIFGDRYRLVEQLGAGGMGEVYRAEHVTIGKSFAIKVLLGEVAADNNMVARFHREAKALSLLSHRNIVSVSDFGETEEGLLYLVTEFVDGTSLSEEMSRREVRIERTIHIVRQIAKALSHAHRRGLVHRDLKPDNVMLVQTDDEPDVVKVLDFGIARVTEAEETETINRLTTQGIVMGTPAYISPEQAMGTVVDHRADLYSLGILLYELLAGQLPFRGKGPIDLMSKHLHQEPPELPREDITGAFKALTMRLLEKDPRNRFKDADTFLTVLEALEETQPSGSYTLLPSDTLDDSLDTQDDLPRRQGSNTMFAPVSDLSQAKPSASSALSLAGPSEEVNLDSLSHPETEVPAPGRGRVVVLVSVLMIAAVAALLFFAGREDQSKAVAAEPVVVLPSVAHQPHDAGLIDEVVTTIPTEEVVTTIPADAALPVTAPITTPATGKTGKSSSRRAPPTLAELQSSVERIGKKMDKLAHSLAKERVDTLRRQWLDLATALPDTADTPEARRNFASRLRRLQSAMKKAGKTP